MKAMSRRPLLAPFNPDTMSGIYPGDRSAVYQRVLGQQIEAADVPAQWLQVSWDGQPPGPLVSVDRGSEEAYCISDFRLVISDPREACRALAAELFARDMDLHACGSCGFWDEVTGTTADELPSGRCAFPVAGVEPALAPPELAVQSAFSLACTHWIPRDQFVPPVKVSDGDHAQANVAPTAAAASEVAGPSPWQRVRSLLTRARRDPDDPRRKPIPLPKKVTAVGTEPCFVCQGRIARLGSHTIRTDEGDNETFTIWRCHICYSTYLGDWIDRWVRLDSLETQEAFYRIAPPVASDLLSRFHAAKVQDAAARQDLELQLRSLTAETEPVSRQVKQGR